MSTPFQVNAEDLHAHSATVSGIAGKVSEAAAAAGTVEMGGHAFGVMCQFLVGSVQESDQSTASAVTSMSHALTSTATDLQSMADDYTASDEASAQLMADLMKQMDHQ